LKSLKVSKIIDQVINQRVGFFYKSMARTITAKIESSKTFLAWATDAGTIS